MGKQTIFGVLAIFIVIIWFGLTLNTPEQSMVSTSPIKVQPAAAQLKPCDQKKADEELHEKMAMFIYKVEGSTVYIREAWYQIPLDKKQALDAMIYCQLYKHARPPHDAQGVPHKNIIYSDYRTGATVAVASDSAFSIN